MVPILRKLVLLVVLVPTVAFAQLREGELSLAMSGAFQPFSITDANGSLVGFDADIATEVAKRLGLEPKLVQIDWSGIQAGLHTEQYDLICGSMAITDERLETMHFTLPYYVSGAQVFVRDGTKSIGGLKFGVTEDSTYAKYIDEHPEEFPGVEVFRYGSEAEIVAAMQSDKVDAFVSDLIVGGFYAGKAKTLDIVPFGDLLYEEPCGNAARNSDAALVRRVNDALFEMVQDGTYARIYEKWVGSPPDLGVLFDNWGAFAKHIPKEDTVSAANDAEFVKDVQGMLPLLARGAWLTLLLSAITAIVALVTGTLVGVGCIARSKIVKALSTGYIALIRGTPLLVQLFISYFVIATLLNRFAGAEIMGAFGAALFALVLNTTAYNAETIRGGISSVEAGQWDAAATLGMQRPLLLKRIILPQAIRNSLPSLGNNLVVLIKDTSLVGAITLIELTYAARNIVFQTGQAFVPFFVAAAFYLVIITTVSLAVRALEKNLNRGRRDARQAA